MPQLGDNPNEVLYEPGTAWAHHNVDNFYDMDSAICRPVDEMLAALEENLECPLVFLTLRREQEAKPLVVTPDIYQACYTLLNEKEESAWPKPRRNPPRVHVLRRHSLLLSKKRVYPWTEEMQAFL